MAAQVMWLMDRLHAHHHTDDDGLWPLIRRGNPAAAGLLEAMQAEHRAIMPAIEAVIAAAQNYRSEPDDAARLELIQALDALTGVLLPHLDRELARSYVLQRMRMLAVTWANDG